MRANRFIVGLVAVVALLSVAALIIRNFPRPQSRDPHNTFYTNLRRITEAKQQWGLEQKVAPDSWPAERDILGYLTPHAERGFGSTVPSLVGEQHIINRTDKPALVYFPKDADDFRGGQALTMEDLQYHYDKKFRKGPSR